MQIEFWWRHISSSYKAVHWNLAYIEPLRNDAWMHKLILTSVLNLNFKNPY